MQPPFWVSLVPPGVQFRLRSLLLVLTWLAVLSALTAPLPALGMIAAVLTVPAIIRTWKYAVRSETGEFPVSTGELADTFVFSLVILIALGGTWLLVAAAAAGVAALAILSTGTWLCGFAAVATSRVGGRLRILLQHAVPITAGQLVVFRRLIRRPSTGLLRWPGCLAMLPGIVICAGIAAGLACGVAAFMTLFALFRGITNSGVGVRWAERQVLAWLHRFLDWKRQLLHRFRGPSSASAVQGDYS